jgi:hypothetical protein
MGQEMPYAMPLYWNVIKYCFVASRKDGDCCAPVEAE